MSRILSDRYHIVRQLGEGGFSAVYQATDRRLDREVAVKILKKELAETEGMVERFMREAKLTASLSHPNSLRIFDYGQSEGELYIVSELLKGVTLDEHLSLNGPVTEQWLIDHFIPLCSALQEAHHIGVIHRDLKPSNLFLQRVGQEERLVLIDFGISKGEGGHIEKVTKTGQLFGTPHYMSPEQIQSPDQVKATSDLYSLGIIIFELLTGHVPFNDESMFKLLSSHINISPPTINEQAPHISIEMNDLVGQLLLKNYQDRPFSAAELATRLRAISSSKVVNHFTSLSSSMTSTKPDLNITLEHAQKNLKQSEPVIGFEVELSPSQFWLKVALGILIFITGLGYTIISLSDESPQALQKSKQALQTTQETQNKKESKPSLEEDDLSTLEPVPLQQDQDVLQLEPTTLKKSLSEGQSSDITRRPQRTTPQKSTLKSKKRSKKAKRIKSQTKKYPKKYKKRSRSKNHTQQTKRSSLLKKSPDGIKTQTVRVPITSSTTATEPTQSSKLQPSSANTPVPNTKSQSTTSVLNNRKSKSIDKVKPKRDSSIYTGTSLAEEQATPTNNGKQVNEKVAPLPPEPPQKAPKPPRPPIGF